MAKKQYVRLLKGRDVSSKCKGLWLPMDIMYDSSLSLIEKMIVAIVGNYQASGKDCYVSNAFFADVCHCTTRTIITNIDRLRTDQTEIDEVGQTVIKRHKILHSRWKMINGTMSRILWIL